MATPYFFFGSEQNLVHSVSNKFTVLNIYKSGKKNKKKKYCVCVRACLLNDQEVFFPKFAS